MRQYAKPRRIFIWESAQKYGKYLLQPWWLFSHVRHQISQYNQVKNQTKVFHCQMEVVLQKKSPWESLMCKCLCLKSQWSSPGFSRLGPLVFCYHGDLSLLGALTLSNTSLGWQTQPPYFWRRWAARTTELSRGAPLSRCKESKEGSLLLVRWPIIVGHQKKCVQSSHFAPKISHPTEEERRGEEAFGGGCVRTNLTQLTYSPVAELSYCQRCFQK